VVPSFLRLENVDKRFGELHVIRQISLEVAKGEILALLGPSGSGKTTLLRLLAGFETPDGGAIHVDGEDVAALPPARRRIGMVFQHYALFPHLTVGENIAFGLDSQGVPRERRAARVAEMLELVDLTGFEDRKVGEISGGQQQRVALARALAPEPRLLLLDEPLSNLDPSLRERTRRQLKETIRQIGITTVLVTHEQEEAFDLGDRVAVLHQGALKQVGTPEELYTAPATRFVATFVGRAGALPGVVEAGGLPGEQGALHLNAAGGIAAWVGVLGEPLEIGERVELVVRPEALRLARSSPRGAVAAQVVERRYTGVLTYFVVRFVDGVEAEVLAPPDAAEVGDPVGVALSEAGPMPRIFRRPEGSAAGPTVRSGPRFAAKRVARQEARQEVGQAARLLTEGTRKGTA
jgi:ABC-type Fe3+/spermidine/putrescine transport system ATPase subunit